MLLDFYGLREQPFGVTPDPRYLYMSRTHREALASLFYGVESGQGFVTLIAKPGMGKTTLLFRLLQELEPSARAVYLFQTQCSLHQFYSILARELGIGAWKDDLGRLREKLNEILLREASLGKHFLLIIDEAHNLQENVLESVRLLSNFETTSAKLMQIVMAGQPQLADKLMRPSLIQLRQRISTVCRICALNPTEVGEYIDHRLRTAGYTGDRIFASAALAAIADESQGIPRVINSLCFNALSLAHAKEEKRVDEADVREVVADLDLHSLGSTEALTRQTALLCANASAKLFPADEKPKPIKQPVPSLFGRLLTLHAALPGPLSSWGARFWPLCLGSLVAALLLVWFVANSIHGGRATMQSQDSSGTSLGTGANSKTGRDPRLDPITVVVRPNDTLSGLCQHYLGWFDDNLAREIYRLNPDIESPYKLRIGQQIRLPRAGRPPTRNPIASPPRRKAISQREREDKY